MVLFTPDFKYKVDSLNLYIIGNYVKRTIGEVYTANGVASCAETINKVHWPYYFFFSII